MAHNLVKNEFNVVGFDVSDKNKNGFCEYGGAWAGTIAEVGVSSDIVFIMVLSGAQALQVVAEGLKDSMKAGSVIVIASSTGLNSMLETEKALEGTGVHLLDCAVSGGKEGAVNANLTFMVSGQKDIFERCDTLLRAMGEKIYYVGEKAGMAQVVKSCHQALLAAVYTATFEAMVLGAKAGVAPEVIQEVISGSLAGSGGFMRASTFLMERRFKDSGSRIDTLYKDLGVIMEMSRGLGVPMITVNAAHELFIAGNAKFPGEDNWCVGKIIEEIAGIEVRKRS
jgi:3-hydroxyisobutyrate dehydrogenase-like beta-hydroxyacid dehydrogenase